MGKIRQTKFSGDDYWSNVLYKNENKNNLPTVITNSLDMDFTAHGLATGTIINGNPITSYGFVWAEHGSPTTADEVVEVDDADFTGEFNNNIDFATAMGETVYVRAYAINSFGTAYGTALNGEVQICLAEGTIIKTLNGNKIKIEDITYNDDLIVWNFDDAKFDHSKPVWMVKPFIANSQAVVEFDNGSKLITVNDGKGHRIYNMELNMFTHMMTDDTPVGTTTFDENGEFIKVIKKEIVKNKTKFYNVVTKHHFNVFANGILTSTGLNNIYPIENMKFIKNNILNNKNEFNISNELFEGLRISEQPSDYPQLKAKLEMMVKRQLIS